MLAVARALVASPSVLMLDEPSAGLSPRLVGVVFERLKAVRDKLAHYAQPTNDPNLKPAALIEKLAAEGGSFAAMGQKKAA